MATTFSQFCDRCKIRHDFGDQLQVRYRHVDGEPYDTWVSGAEASQRWRSDVTEEQLRSLSRLDIDTLRIVLDSLPDKVRDKARRSLRERAADELKEQIGGNVIGDSLSDALRGRSSTPETAASERERWRALLQYAPFRLKVLELAWIQLEGSFPDTEQPSEPDDWL